MDLDDLTGVVDRADLAERAQEAERANHGSYALQNAAAEPAGEFIAQVAWQILTLPWSCVRGVGHGIVATLEVGGEIIAAIFEALAGGL